MRVIIIAIILMLLPSFALAKTETVFANFKYTMGDNDSKNDAKRIAFVEAKRLAIEKAGILIESETVVTNSTLTKDEIKSYTGAIIKVEIDKEIFETTGNIQILNMTVKAKIDTDSVKQVIENIKNDKGLQKKLTEQQKNITALENKLNEIQKNLYKPNKDSMELRKERADILTAISELEKLQNTLELMSDKVIKNVRNGMTIEEVRSLIGFQRIYDNYQRQYDSPIRGCYNYGRYWIIEEHELVVGYALQNDYRGCGNIRKIKPFKPLLK